MIIGVVNGEEEEIMAYRKDSDQVEQCLSLIHISPPPFSPVVGSKTPILITFSSDSEEDEEPPPQPACLLYTSRCV